MTVIPHQKNLIINSKFLVVFPQILLNILYIVFTFSLITHLLSLIISDQILLNLTFEFIRTNFKSWIDNESRLGITSLIILVLWAIYFLNQIDLPFKKIIAACRECLTSYTINQNCICIKSRTTLFRKKIHRIFFDGIIETSMTKNWILGGNILITVTSQSTNSSVKTHIWIQNIQNPEKTIRQILQSNNAIPEMQKNDQP